MKKIIIFLFVAAFFKVNAQTPNSLGGSIVNKDVEDFTSTVSAQVDSFIIELVDGSLLKVAKTIKVKLSNAAPVGTAVSEMWIDTLGVDTQYINNNGTWVRFTVGSTATTTLDDAYNNFGATASKITVDAAQGQTGGLEIETGSNTNVIVDLQGNSNFIIQDGGVTNIFNADGASGEVRLISNTDNGAFKFQVNDNAYFASTVDFASSWRDNRANGFWTQSSSATASNRTATFGNSSYSQARFTFKGLFFDPTGLYTMHGNYGFFADLGTSTSGISSGKMFFKTATATAASSTQGGDFLIELGAGDGIGRQGRVGIGLGNTYASDAVSAPTAMLDVNGTGRFRDSLTVTDVAYNATTWNNSNRVPTMNAIRDKFESLSGWNHSATQDIDLNQFNIVDVNKMTSDSADIDEFVGTTKFNGAMNINGNNINNAAQLNGDSCNVLNGAFENAPTYNYQNYTATGTLNRELAHYWDGTSDDTLTTNTALPDETPFFVKNNDASLLLTILPGSGHTMNGDGRVYAGEACWFQKHGTVIERITPFRHDYRADLSPTTDASGDFTITHNLGTSNVVYFLTPICDACRYSFRRKTTSGITSNTIVIRVYDETTGLALASTSLSCSVMVQRIN